MMHKPGAVVLAAGRSRRMGKPKLLLPWGKGTVIGHVIAVLREAIISDIVVVTGAEQERIKAAAAEDSSENAIHFAHNPQYETTEMLVSLQIGLRALGEDCSAALVVLGDQPVISAGVIRAVVDAHLETRSALVVPSFKMRRGHPWLVAREYWPELLAMRADQNPRDFLDAHKDVIHYVVIDAPEVLEDLDTPEDYARLHDQKPPR